MDLKRFATAFVLAAGIQVSGATFTVTKTADTNDGICNADCSLREAIDAARLIAVVVFPTPPFWFAIAMTRPMPPPVDLPSGLISSLRRIETIRA